jgi:hypothetical protein
MLNDNFNTHNSDLVAPYREQLETAVHGALRLIERGTDSEEALRRYNQIMKPIWNYPGFRSCNRFTKGSNNE